MYLSLNGMIYRNNSIISISDIGMTDSDQNKGLQCITDKNLCCKFSNGNNLGEWMFPDNSVVPKRNDAEGFYRNRDEGDGTVNLNRVNSSIMSPTGLFCCKVPDANDKIKTLCTYIGKIDIYDHRESDWYA